MAQYRNSLRTKKFIRNAFAELIAEKKEISKITIKELTERADISKSSFYAHYEDIYDLLDEFEDELIDTINTTINEYFKDNPESFSPYINKLLSLFSENEELYKKLFKSESTTNFINKVRNSLAEKLMGQAKREFKNVDTEIISFYINLFTNGITYIVADHFNGTNNMSLEEIANNSNEFLKKLLGQLKKENIIS